jgi:hypothetical protein
MTDQAKSPAGVKTRAEMTASELEYTMQTGRPVYKRIETMTEREVRDFKRENGLRDRRAWAR